MEGRMPRKNPPRTVPFESNVAANLGRERERTGITFERLAERMTERGCPIQPSALHKIEKGDPPRRVTVNELMVMADVLGVKAFDLVDDPDKSVPSEVWQAVAQVEEHERAIERARRGIAEAVERLRAMLAGNDRHRVLLRRVIAEDWADWPEVRAHLAPALRAPKKGESR
jgi:transcriptional regulator with XRE-family HTH domain